MKEGRILGDRYRIISPLAKGGMGSLWRAVHVVLGTPVAIKVISANLLDSPEAVARFKREARAAAAVRSAHVVQILDFGIDGGIPYIAMELLEGESLAQRLARRGPMKFTHCLEMLQQVGRALEVAHGLGIVHRDLKPPNVFLVREGPREVVKLLDFGIAKASVDGASDAFNTRRGACIGTPQYMSPEQISGIDVGDHRSDIWALGVLGFECLLGSAPFRADDLTSLAIRICVAPIPVPSQCGSVPDGFDTWFARSVERVISRRFQAVRAQISALESIGSMAATSDQSNAIEAEDAARPDPRGVDSQLAPPICTAPDSFLATKTNVPPVLTAQRSVRTRTPLAMILTSAFVIIAIAGGLVRTNTPRNSQSEPELTRPYLHAASQHVQGVGNGPTPDEVRTTGDKSGLFPNASRDAGPATVSSAFAPAPITSTSGAIGKAELTPPRTSARHPPHKETPEERLAF